MKKLLTLFVFALVAFTANAQSTQKGDVNGDGDVSVNDVAMIVNYILGELHSRQCRHQRRWRNRHQRRDGHRQYHLGR